MNRQTNQSGKPRSTITWVATFLSLAFLVASSALALGSGEAFEDTDPNGDTDAERHEDDLDQGRP